MVGIWLSITVKLSSVIGKDKSLHDFENFDDLWWAIPFE
jgi:hypothetical protein